MRKVENLASFTHRDVNLDILKKRAYNYRWAEVPDGVIPLTAADPDFAVAPEITDALIDYVKDGYLSYTPKLGLPEFSESMSRALYARKREVVLPDLILPIDSAARGMHVIARAILCAGDEAIVFDPVDYLFKQAVLSAGAVPVLFASKVTDGKLDLSRLPEYIGPRTKMICLCNPHNPLGMVYPEEDLDFLLTVAERHDLWIMNDETWSDIVFPPKRFNSIVEFGEARNKKTLSVYGLSKSFGVAGLRIGCIYCHDRQVFEQIVQTSGVMTTAGGVTSLSQIAGIACLDKCYYWVDEFLAHLKSNRDYALERLNAMPNVTCHKPDATYLLFPNISATGLISEDFVDYIQREYRLALVPGADRFFGPGGEGHVRLCFATSFEILKEGLDRLEAGVLNLNRGRRTN